MFRATQPKDQLEGTRNVVPLEKRIVAKVRTQEFPLESYNTTNTTSVAQDVFLLRILTITFQPKEDLFLLYIAVTPCSDNQWDVSGLNSEEVPTLL